MGFTPTLRFAQMRHHYISNSDKPPVHGQIYYCDHPVYNSCTLYSAKGKGIAVIQQRYDLSTKATYWTAIDPNLVEDIYDRPNFKDLFRAKALLPENGIFPTITVRQLMWKLRMKPLKKERWETTFDHQDI